MRVPRVSSFARFGVLGLLLAGVLLLAAGVDGLPARGRDHHEDEPKLELPGGCVVGPGRTIELTWSSDTSVRELEILMSIDGGRHYAVQISPSLDPSCGRFTWRVPRVPAAHVCLRVRFNRDGREIEGSPVALTTASDPRDVLPLALPSRTGGAPEPRPAGGSTRAEASTMDTVDDKDALDTPVAHAHPCDVESRGTESVGVRRGPAAIRSTPPDTSPRNVPLRT